MTPRPRTASLAPARPFDLAHESPSRRLALLLFVPLLLGLGIGALAGLDPWLGSLYPLRKWEINHRLPFLYSVLALVLMLSGWLIWRHARWIFTHRDQIALAIALSFGSASGFNLGLLDPTDFSFMILFTYWVSVSLIEHRPVRFSPFAMSMLLVLVISSMASIVNGLGISILKQNTLITKLMMYAMLVSLISTPELLRAAVRIFVGVAIASALVGIAAEIIYLVFDYPFTLDDQPQFAFKSTPFGMMLRVTGFLPRTQALAHLLVLACGLALFMPMRARWRWISLAILGTGILFTFSFGAYLILAGMLILWVFMRRPALTVHYLAIAAAIALTLYVTGGWEWLDVNVAQRFAGKSGEDRIAYLNVGLRVIENHPWLGIGLKNITRALHTLIHNTYLQTAAEMGAISGVALTLLVLTLLGRSFFTAGVMRRDDPAKPWLQGLALSMTAMAVHFMVEPYYDNYFSWIFMGLVNSALLIHVNAPRLRIEWRARTAPEPVLLRARSGAAAPASRALGFGLGRRTPQT